MIFVFYIFVNFYSFFTGPRAYSILIDGQDSMILYILEALSKKHYLIMPNYIFDHGDLSLKVQYVEFDFDVKFLTLMYPLVET